MTINHNGTRSGQRQKASLDQQLVAWGRRESSTGVDWTQLDSRLLAAAMSVCVAANVGITIGQAAGGRGVVLTPYQHPLRYERQYAATHEELTELLWALIDTFASPSEDISQIWALTRG